MAKRNPNNPKRTASEQMSAEEHVEQIMRGSPELPEAEVSTDQQSTGDKLSTDTELAASLPDKKAASSAGDELEAQDAEALPVARGEDSQTDDAVDDIVRRDADALFEDKATATNTSHARSFARRCKDAWLYWWRSPWKKWGTIFGLALIIAVPMFIAPARAYVLNSFGVRTSMIVTVYDGASKLPLDNAVVLVDGISAKTNEKGEAKVRGIRLGEQEVVISKAAFASYKKQTTFGMRIVDLGEVTLKAVGLQMSYHFTDYLSGKPIAGVTLESGEATARSDKKGKAVLTVRPEDIAPVAMKKEGYRSETMAPLPAEKHTEHVALVPSAQAVFVTKERGTYDVYKMSVDGRDREILLPGTGLEGQTISALPSQDSKRVAVSSTRDEKRNSDGYLLTALTVVDLTSGEQNTIEHAEQITLLGWRGEALVYLQTVAGVSAANPARQRIISYDFATNKRFQLASANYFAGQELIGSTLYYAVSATDPASPSVFAKVNIDTSSRKTLLSAVVWSLLRTDYNKLKLQTPDKWYEYMVGSANPVESSPESNYIHRYYVDSTDGKQSVRVDVRDSNGVLMLRDVAAGREKELSTQRNMQAPLYWLSDSIVVYRVSGAAEVADYVVSTGGGTAKKLSDVSLSGIR